MSKIEAFLVVFLILFIIIFLLDYFLIKKSYLRKMNGKKKGKKKNNELIELEYLITKFKLDKNSLPIRKLLLIVSTINGFIISLVAVIVIILNINIIIQLLIGFILLIGLIYALYEILGRNLVKRGYGKNGK